MKLTCNLFGHKFRYAQQGDRVPVRVCNGSSSNVIRTYDGLYVKKWCKRCGYEHADTFEINGTATRMA